MADTEQRQGRSAFGRRGEGERGEFGGRGGRGGRGGDRGRGGERGRGRGRGRGGRGGGGRGDDEKDWVPVTKLGRLVKDRKITSLEEIFLHSLPIKEAPIVDTLIPKGKLKDEVMKISPVQKQTRAGQRTRFKAFVVVGDEDGHVGLGVKTSAEVANAIKGAIILSKLSVVPVRRGYWGNKLGDPHTIPAKVTGKCGSVRVRLIPAPKGAGVVASPVPKKVIELAGIQDVYSGSRGHTKTLGNFIKATFDALNQTYSFLTPELWAENSWQKNPLEEHSAYLAAGKKK